MLRKIQADNVTVMAAVPNWLSAPWFHLWRKMVVRDIQFDKPMFWTHLVISDLNPDGLYALVFCVAFAKRKFSTYAFTILSTLPRNSLILLDWFLFYVSVYFPAFSSTLCFSHLSVISLSPLRHPYRVRIKLAYLTP